jgi:hypothetical protein
MGCRVETVNQGVMDCLDDQDPLDPWANVGRAASLEHQRDLGRRARWETGACRGSMDSLPSLAGRDRGVSPDYLEPMAFLGVRDRRAMRVGTENRGLRDHRVMKGSGLMGRRGIWGIQGQLDFPARQGDQGGLERRGPRAILDPRVARGPGALRENQAGLENLVLLALLDFPGGKASQAGQD